MRVENTNAVSIAQYLKKVYMVDSSNSLDISKQKSNTVKTCKTPILKTPNLKNYESKMVYLVEILLTLVLVVAISVTCFKVL